MSSENRAEFRKENIDLYLREVAKEYRKLTGKGTPAEMILIGGASVLVNYGFRNMTTDIDALILAASGMKDAINNVGNRYNLPPGWLNADFRSTDSYSSKIVLHSKYYKTFSNVLTIRTVSAEYLVAMKLRSGRQYKNDLSDIIGVLAEHEKAGMPISIEDIRRAVEELYGSWEMLPETSASFIDDVVTDGDYDRLFRETFEGEKEARTLLIQFEQDYPGVTKETNVNSIIDSLRKRKTNS